MKLYSEERLARSFVFSSPIMTRTNFAVLIGKNGNQVVLMSGVITNVGTIIIGTLLGIAVGGLFNDRLRDICFQAVGLAVLGMGLVMAYDGISQLSASELGGYGLILFSFSLVIGALIGEICKLDVLLEQLGSAIQVGMEKLTSKSAKGKASAGDKTAAPSDISAHDAEAAEALAVQEADPDTNRAQKFIEGFVSASILFCVGTMAVLGSIQDGLGDHSTLYLKSMLDGITSIILGSTLGIGVGFSAIPIFVIQGAISLFARALEPYLGAVVISAISAVGGVMLIAMAANMLKFTEKEIKIVNMLPALFIAGVLAVVLT